MRTDSGVLFRSGAGSLFRARGSTAATERRKRCGLATFPHRMASTRRAAPCECYARSLREQRCNNRSAMWGHPLQRFNIQCRSPGGCSWDSRVNEGLLCAFEPAGEIVVSIAAYPFIAWNPIRELEAFTPMLSVIIRRLWRQVLIGFPGCPIVLKIGMLLPILTYYESEVVKWIRPLQKCLPVFVGNGIDVNAE